MGLGFWVWVADVWSFLVLGFVYSLFGEFGSLLGGDKSMFLDLNVRFVMMSSDSEFRVVNIFYFESEVSNTSD